jgi:hypothetical protein
VAVELLAQAVRKGPGRPEGTNPSDEVDDLTDVAAVLTYWLGGNLEKVGPDKYVIEQEANSDARFDYYSQGGRFEGAAAPRRRVGELLA